jgi:hypothetical protein
MRSSPASDLLPFMLYCTGVLQPVGEEELLTASAELAQAGGNVASPAELRDALKHARNEGYLWHLGGRRFSLTPAGEALLRGLGLPRLRDKERLWHLAALAKGI